MEKYMIINNTPHNLFIDLDGNEKTDDIIVLGPRAKEIVELSDKRVAELREEFGANLVIRKVR